MSALSASAGMSMKVSRPMSGGASIVQLDRAVTLDEARAVAARLAQDPAVEYAVPDVMLRKAAVPNEPRYVQWQWNLFDPSAQYTGAVGAVTKSAAAVGGSNLPGAWDLTTGSNAVIVAVVDSGIANHPDLNGLTGTPYAPSGRFLPGYDFISDNVGAPELPTNFVANDGNGRDSDPSDPGDWVTANEKAMYDSCDDGRAGQTDSSWHGTHMAGIVGATANNGAGIAGIGWNVRVLPVRALGKCGGTTSDIADAIRWSAGLAVMGVPNNPNPANVISLSLGGPGACSAPLQAAVTAAVNAGAVIVAATGNDGDNQIGAPGNCNGVIAVTAHTINGESADYANVGSGTAISAPGGGKPAVLGTGGA
ncbi:MAG TPA: S8 family serine peptidase, partial [Pseudomonadales bacterium]